MSFISPLGIKDAYGTNIGSYEVQYNPGLLDIVGHGMAMVISLIYSGFVQPVAGLSAWIISKVAQPQGFFRPVEAAYAKLLEPVVSLVDPALFGTMVASATMMVMFFNRSSVMSVARNDLFQRALNSFLVIVVATVLAMNPFKLLRKVFDVTNELVNEVTRGAAGASANGDMSAHFLTTVTQLINFGRPLNDSASQVWSRTLAAGGKIKDVPELGDIIKDVGPGGVFSALAAGFAGIAMIAFAVVALAYMTYYLWELTWRTVAMPWFMYYAAFQFRRLELIWETLGRIVSYLFMTAIIALLAILGPILASGIINDIFGGRYASLQIVTSILAYSFMAWFMHRICAPNGRFAEIMRLSGRNQWRGYMQRSSILMAKDKVVQGTAKAVDYGGKAGGAVVTALTGNAAAGAAVMSATGGVSRAIESRGHSAGERVSNELPRGKENMLALDAVPQEAMQTSFSPAPAAAALPPAYSYSQLRGQEGLAHVKGAAVLGALGGAADGEGGVAGRARAAVAGGVEGAKQTGREVFALPAGQTSEQGRDGDTTDAAAAEGAQPRAGSAAQTPAAESGALPILEGEVVEDHGMVNSLNFPTAGDAEGVQGFVNMRALARAAQPEEPGMEGTAVVGSAPPVPQPHPAPDAAESLMRASLTPLFYSADDTGETVAVYDPRVPLSESVREQFAADSDVEFADTSSLGNETSLPEGVEVYQGRAVWVSPQSEEMVELTAPVAKSMQDTVTFEGMRDRAAAIADPQVREVFMVHHGLYGDAPVPQDEVADGADDAAAVAGAVSSPDADSPAATTDDPVEQEPAERTVGQSRVTSDRDDAVESVAGSSTWQEPVVETPQQPAQQTETQTAQQPVAPSVEQPAQQTDPQTGAQTGEQPDTQTAQQPETQPVAPAGEQTETQPETQPGVQPEASASEQPETQTAPQPALSAKSIAPENTARMAEEVERADAERVDVQDEPKREVVEVHRPEPQPVQRKAYTPTDYKQDREALDRHKSAGRAGTSTTSVTGTGRGSVEVPRTLRTPEQFVSAAASFVSDSVVSATFHAAADAATEESRFISQAMAGGGMVNVPVDDPEIVATTFVTVDGKNVVGGGGALMGY